jgi:glutaminase
MLDELTTLADGGRRVPAFGGRVETPDSVADLQALIEEVADNCAPLADQGETADYIPALARVPRDRFAIAMSTLDDDEPVVGDADVRLSIQSISKLFTLTLAMRKVDDIATLWERVGREPSGTSFNSLVQLEHEHGVPRNPFINPGAIVVADHLLDACDDPRAELLELLSELAGSPVEVDEQVWASERETGTRNRAIANLMAGFGNLRNPVEDVLDSYFHQCAVEMTPRQLARAVRFVANDGIDPATGRAVVTPEQSRRLGALMLTCGTYDAAGEFAFQVGMPCKSGVGGAIVAVVPDVLGVCVWSPPLDANGNSLAGSAALTRLATRGGLSIF